MGEADTPRERLLTYLFVGMVVLYEGRAVIGAAGVLVVMGAIAARHPERALTTARNVGAFLLAGTAVTVACVALVVTIGYIAMRVPWLSVDFEEEL